MPGSPRREPTRRPTFALDAPTDADFAARGAEVACYLYDCFPSLRGLSQRSPHFDPARGRTTDPVEHTVEVVQLLDTTGLVPRDRLLLRAAAIFHDVGKVLDPLDPRHAAASAELCAPLLVDFELTSEERADAIAVIAAHDVLGQVAGERLTPAAATTLFRTPRLAEITRRLTVADVTSIRGLTGARARIDAAYLEVRAAFDAIDGQG